MLVNCPNTDFKGLSCGVQHSLLEILDAVTQFATQKYFNNESFPGLVLWRLGARLSLGPSDVKVQIVQWDYFQSCDFKTILNMFPCSAALLKLTLFCQVLHNSQFSNKERAAPQIYSRW